MVLKILLGKLRDSEGNQIEGSFLNHKAEGACEIRLANGNNYLGNLSKGLKNGSGQFFFLKKTFWSILQKGKLCDNVEKSEYEGEWENDKKHGHFLLCERNKDFYCKKIGKGTFIHLVKNYKYEGNWINDTPEGLVLVLNN